MGRCATYLVIFLALATGRPAAGQDAVTSAELDAIVAQARAARELGDLNKVRIVLRNIDFESLSSVADRKRYAEAYRLLAWSHRRNRYIRPGYDLYSNYIALRDTIFEAKRRHELDSVRSAYQVIRTGLESELKKRLEEESQLKRNKVALDNTRGIYWLIRLAIVVGILSVFAYMLVVIRKKTAKAMREKEGNFEKLSALSDQVIKGQMTTGALYHALILNQRVQSETDKINKLLPGIEERFKKVKEAAEVLKNSKDNLSRIGKLVELTGNALHNFFRSMPRFSLKEVGEDGEDRKT